MANESNSKNRIDESSYNGQYPYVQVIEWPDGTQIHIDKTPGNERLYLGHSSGTHFEISSDGKLQIYAVGDTKMYHKGGATTTFDENGDIKVGGHARFMAGGGAHIEVAGDAGVFVGGDMAAAVMGKLNARASSAYVGTDGDLSLNVSGNMNMQVKGNTTMHTGGDHVITSGGDVKIN